MSKQTAWAEQSKVQIATDNAGDNSCISIRQPEFFKTREECVQGMSDCDSRIAKLDARIRELKSKKPAHGLAEVRQLTYTRRMIGSRRMQIQERLGEINRDARRERTEKMNVRFIDAAMRLLPKETIMLIWDEVHRNANSAESEGA